MNDFRPTDSLSEQIARHIGKLIVSGELKAGDRIQEMRIASELNVSRGSVREAYLILERRYLINIMPRKGAVVASLTPTHVKSMYEMNALLLSLLIRKISRHWQEEDLQPFQALLQDMHAYIEQGHVQKFHEATFQYVHMAQKFADNLYLNEMLDNLQPSLHRTNFLALKQGQGEMEASLQFLQVLMERILARDENGAVKTLEEFAEHQCQVVLRHLVE